MDHAEPTTLSAVPAVSVPPASPDAEQDDSARADQRPSHFAELEDIGMGMARTINELFLKAAGHEAAVYDAAEAAAQAGAPPEPLKLRLNSPTLVQGFTRLVRTMRDLAAPLATGGGAGAAGPRSPAAPRMSPAAKRRLNGLKNEVRQHVERSVNTYAEPQDVQRLLLQLDKRLDDADVEAEFSTMTIGQMVIGFCYELGVKTEMTQWSDEMLRTAYIAETGREPDLPPPPKGGMTKGLPAEERLDKLPNGEIGTPGVPPAIDVPPMEYPYASQQPPAPPPPVDARPPSSPARVPSALPRLPPGASFAR